MNIIRVEIERVIVHEVIKPTQVSERPPVFSDELVILDQRGKDLVAKRIVDTVSAGSTCVDVDVEDASPGSPFDLTTEMFDDSDSSFIARSKQLADMLAKAQSAGGIKSGVAFFVQGSCVVDGQRRRFMATIKADSDEALVKNLTGEGIALSFVSETFLGASQRLIKIGFIFEMINRQKNLGQRVPGEFSIKVFDHLMQNPSGDAAQYFYNKFLKCTLSRDAAHKTQEFYELTKQFIRSMECPPEEQLELLADLGSYLRSNQATIHPRTFAADHLPKEVRDDFVNQCKSSKMASAFSKDTQRLTPKLKKFSLKFSCKVAITGPQDQWNETVKIIDSDGEWTTIKIRGEIEGVS